MVKRTLLFVALVLAARGSPAATPDPGLLDARSLAMGGALRSLAERSAAARLNPAGLSLQRGFFGQGSYATRKEGPLDAFRITLVDNITSPLGGALQYLRVQGDLEREEVGLSISGGRTGLWWGFTGRFVHARNRGTTAWDDAWTGDVGFLFARPGGIRLAAVGYDLLDTTSPFLERRIALAASWTASKRLVLAGDTVRNLDREFDRGLDFHLGAEYRGRASPWLLRAGQFWAGATGKSYASGGFGWARDSLEVGYAIQRAWQDAPETLHVFSLEGSF